MKCLCGKEMGEVCTHGAGCDSYSIEYRCTCGIKGFKSAEVHKSWDGKFIEDISYRYSYMRNGEFVTK